MTAQGQVDFEKDGAVALVTLNRPEKLNAVTAHMAEELDALTYRINADRDIAAVVLRAAGTKAFCVGSDLGGVDEYDTPWAFRNRALARRVAWNEFGPALRQPVVAAVGGYCVGGGFELVLNVDLRVAATDAVFGAPEVKLGWIGGGAASQLLPRMVGPGRAFELLALGDNIPAATALEWGIVNRVVERSELDRAALDLARELAERPPIAVQVVKQAVRYALNTPLDTGRLIENDLVWATFTTEDKQEGLRAFLEKRPPHFRGR